jgi:hypothetical protein
MHIRDLARRTWQERGLYASRNAQLRAFLALLDEHPDWTFEDVLSEIRANHAELYTLLVSPLLDTSDKLLRVVLIRNADVGSRRELGLLKAFMQSADPMEDEPELLALASLGHTGLTDELRKRAPLSSALSAIPSSQPIAARRATNVDARPGPPGGEERVGERRATQRRRRARGSPSGEA